MTKTKENREWLVQLANKTRGTEFSVLSEPSANKTAPPVLSGETPILQKNEYCSEKCSLWSDLIGWEHPHSVRHAKIVIWWSYSIWYVSYIIKNFCPVLWMVYFDWLRSILQGSSSVSVFVLWQGQYSAFWTKSECYFLFCFCFCHWQGSA